MSTYCYLSETESEREGKTLALESSLPSPTSCNLCSHGEYQSSEGYDPTYCIILTHSFTFTLGFVNSNTNLTSFLSSFSQNLIFRFLQSVSPLPLSVCLLIPSGFSLIPLTLMLIYSESTHSDLAIWAKGFEDWRPNHCESYFLCLFVTWVFIKIVFSRL